MMTLPRLQRRLWIALTLTLLCARASSDNLIQMSRFSLFELAAGAARMEPLPDSLTSGVRITVVTPTEPYYRLMITQPVPVAVPEGSRLRLRFRARSATRNPMRAIVEQSTSPYTAVLQDSPTLPPDWRTYTLAGTARAYDVGGLSVRFQFGHRTGTIEIADVTLENMGLDPELVAARAAITPAAIAARIERYRKGRLTICVLDRNGRPVRNARVAVEQTRHAFLFGCDLFGLQPENSDPLQTAYQERFAALFNYATLPFYWGSYEAQRGRKDEARLQRMAQWCRMHRIIPKGHPLVWHEVYPAWAPSDPDEAVPLLRDRVFDLLSRFRGSVRYWDVLNEANNAVDHADTGEGAWIRRDGAVSVVATTLGWAREAGRGAGNTLLYNDFNTGEKNVQLLEGLRQRGAFPDAIGIQSHMHGGTWPLTEVWRTAERFGRFGVPVHFTETTVLSGPARAGVDMAHPPSDWVTTPEEEARQAEYVAAFYSVLFSHPAVRAITWWDLSDLAAWQNAPAGLLRKDMTPKPAYDRLLALVRHAWWTRAQGATDRSGRFAVRPFYGEHRVTVRDARGHTTTSSVLLPMGAPAKTVTVRLP